MKKLQPSFYPPNALENFRRAVSAWLWATAKRDRELGRWAREISADEDVVSALVELVCWHKVAPNDLLEFLAELRTVHVPARELRARVKALGKQWKEIETLAHKAREKSEPYLRDQRARAVEIENAARLLSRFFSSPRGNRPLETEIADCKESVKAFLRRRGVRKVNDYGWILLKAVFGKLWRAGDGRDQIEAFRQIPRPYRGRIRNRVDAERVIEKAKVDLFRMEQSTRKS